MPSIIRGEKGIPVEGFEMQRKANMSQPKSRMAIARAPEINSLIIIGGSIITTGISEAATS
jgi:hypothetical protein